MTISPSNDPAKVLLQLAAVAKLPISSSLAVDVKAWY